MPPKPRAKKAKTVAAASTPSMLPTTALTRGQKAAATRAANKLAKAAAAAAASTAPTVVTNAVVPTVNELESESEPEEVPSKGTKRVLVHARSKRDSSTRVSTTSTGEERDDDEDISSSASLKDSDEEIVEADDADDKAELGLGDGRLARTVEQELPVWVSSTAAPTPMPTPVFAPAPAMLAPATPMAPAPAPAPAAPMVPAPVTPVALAPAVPMAHAPAAPMMAAPAEPMTPMAVPTHIPPVPAPAPMPAPAHVPVPVAAAAGPVFPTETDIVPSPVGGRIRLNDQQPPVKTTVQNAMTIATDKLIAADGNAFPDSSTSNTYIREAMILAALRSVHTFPVELRLRQEIGYAERLRPIVSARMPLARHAVRAASDQLVDSAYHLPPPGPARQTTVTTALHDWNYVFPRGGVNENGPWQRNLFYRRQIGVDVLHASIIDEGYLLRNVNALPFTLDEAGQPRRELTKAAVALAYTAIYASLYSWRTGVFVKHEFSSNMFREVYVGHINTLEHIEANRPVAYHDLMSDLYNRVANFAAVENVAAVAAPGIAPIMFE
ncbi:hypothetical protein PENSPDRAFT_666727 [Peniophora sp. CONT]|nr:hypothetical protein PENSPDRAFT_666727 [Peniophora sp. CONT]